MLSQIIHYIFKVFTLLFLLIGSITTYGQDPQVARMTTDGRGYLEYLPSGYSASSSKLYPAIIFLHGSGERGTGSATDLEKVKVHGPPKHIKNGHNMCFTINGKTECFIVLSPQTSDWSWKNDAVPLVNYALQKYRIDPDRIYVTGLSMGGEGAWLAGSLDDNVPNYFAALAPIAGRATEADGTSIANKKIPVWAFHGDDDGSISIALDQRVIDAMIAANADPAPIFTIYPNVGHGGAWDRAYRTDHTYHNPNVYEWFLTQKRGGQTARVAPTVNAGANKTITLPVNSTSITATATDTDGTIASYAWTKVSGPSATLANASTKTLSVSNAVAGTYVFRITVTDDTDMTATDDMTLTVNAATTANQAPTVEAGAKKTITLPTSTASFTAVASDPDGTIASYSWTKIGGCAITMSGTSTATLAVRNATKCTYVFRIQVTDDKGATASDTVRLVVNEASTTTNQPPTVEAGAKQSISLPLNTASFTAKASDPDGTIASYSWTKIGGCAITMSGTSSATLAVSNAVACTYVFRIQVTDNNGATASDTVRLAVSAVTTVTAARTATEPTPSSEEESVLSLGQNYPNPFSVTTTIPFSLDESQSVVLKVYNALGVELATLVNEFLSAGPHAIELSSTTLAKGGEATNGVFYYKLYSKDKIQTNRLLLSSGF